MIRYLPFATINLDKHRPDRDDEVRYLLNLNAFVRRYSLLKDRTLVDHRLWNPKADKN